MDDKDLAAALNEREITDADGNITEENTFEEESATYEQETPVDNSDEVESPEEVVPTQSATTDNANDYAEDETGKKYIPKERFDQIYGRYKALEREVQKPRKETSSKVKGPDKIESIEMELLYEKYPEFDPYSNSYDKNLDRLGGLAIKADPSMTRLEAARRAKEMARELATRGQEERARTLDVKRVQSEGGMTHSGLTRQSPSADPSKMSEAEMEVFLKQSGQW